MEHAQLCLQTRKRAASRQSVSRDPQPQSVCVPFPSDKVTKSPISGGGENDALPSSSAAPTVGAGGLISPGKGQKDREAEKERERGNKRRKVGRIIHIDEEDVEDDDDEDDEEGD